MSELTHAQMVTGLVKDPTIIWENLSATKVDLIHAVLGISGEAGELLDAVKKHAIYGKPLDIENVIEELGDLEFYMEQLRQRLGILREQTLARNIHKLGARYKGHRYTDEQAISRNDKIEFDDGPTAA